MGSELGSSEVVEVPVPDLSPGHPVIWSPAHPLRAWCFLVWLSIVRQARVRQMIWIALALLALTATVIGLNTVAGRWGMGHWRWNWLAPSRGFISPGGMGLHVPRVVTSTFAQSSKELEIMSRTATPLSPNALALEDAIATASQALLKRSEFYVFSNWVVFSVVLSFLLPIWSLSFATEAMGGEREGRTLVWLLSRPLPRPVIYLAKFVALLPWSLGFNLGGFALLCLLAGNPGQLALRLYWPAVLAGSLAFCALFHLAGTCVRRSAIVALVYSFFLETILGNMPGSMKRISIGFYTRCLMFDAAQDYGVQAEKPSIYLPVTGPTAWWVLLGLTLILLGVGMAIFARSEYQDLA